MINETGFGIILMVSLALALDLSAETTPATPDTVRFSFQEVSGVGHEKGVCRRDPSDVIRVGDTWYVWYTRVAADAPLYPSGYFGTIWYATSTDAGRTWIEQGLAVGKGREDAFDAHAVFTPNIFAQDGRFYLYYTAVATGFRNTRYSKMGMTRIGVATASSPAGPWTKPAGNVVIEPSPDHAAFDSYRVDDACLLLRDGRVWLYYKGRQWERTPGETKMGVAAADHPLGPFTKLNQGRFVQDSGHEVLVWPFQRGVRSLASDTGPRGRSLFYAADGLSFRVTHSGLQGLPKAPGSYREDLSGTPGYHEGITWGISMIHGPDPYLVRFTIPAGPM